jgi:hypothetical protein
MFSGGEGGNKVFGSKTKTLKFLSLSFSCFFFYPIISVDIAPRFPGGGGGIFPNIYTYYIDLPNTPPTPSPRPTPTSVYRMHLPVHRSGHCAGGRGLFCGVCLFNRYGLDAKEELKVRKPLPCPLVGSFSQ